MSTSPSPQKRGRDVVDAASSALRVRMDKEFLAVQGHLKRAKNYAPAPLRSSASGARVVSSTPRRTTSQPKASTEAAYQTRITAQEANSKQQHHPYPIHPAVPDNELRPAEASTSPSQKRGRDVDAASSSALQVPMDEELPGLKKAKPLPPSTPPAADEKKNNAPSPAGRSSASGAPVVVSSTANTTTTSQPIAETECAYQKEREEFRQMLLEMEKSALPDQTIYPEDLEELGLASWNMHVVTRTRKRAWFEDHTPRP